MGYLYIYIPFSEEQEYRKLNKEDRSKINKELHKGFKLLLKNSGQSISENIKA